LKQVATSTVENANVKTQVSPAGGSAPRSRSDATIVAHALSPQHPKQMPSPKPERAEAKRQTLGPRAEVATSPTPRIRGPGVHPTEATSNNKSPGITPQMNIQITPRAKDYLEGPRPAPSSASSAMTPISDPLPNTTAEPPRSAPPGLPPAGFDRSLLRQQGQAARKLARGVAARLGRAERERLLSKGRRLLDRARNTTKGVGKSISESLTPSRLQTKSRPPVSPQPVMSQSKVGGRTSASGGGEIHPAPANAPKHTPKRSAPVPPTNTNVMTEAHNPRPSQTPSSQPRTGAQYSSDEVVDDGWDFDDI